MLVIPRGISSTSGPFDPVISTNFPRNPAISMIGRPIPYILVVWFCRSIPWSLPEQSRYLDDSWTVRSRNLYRFCEQSRYLDDSYPRSSDLECFHFRISLSIWGPFIIHRGGTHVFSQYFFWLVWRFRLLRRGIYLQELLNKREVNTKTNLNENFNSSKKSPSYGIFCW